MQTLGISLLGLLVIILFPLAGCQNPNSKVKVAIYKDPACTGPVAGVLVLDIAKSCSNYSYVDSKGVTTQGSNGNFRCYADKLVYDKYPFATDCDPTAKIIEHNHAVSASPQGCLRAPSHEGDVFERLLDYKYQGKENCRK